MKKQKDFQIVSENLTTDSEKRYTDSAMSDKIKEFFNRFKDNNGYKYSKMIDVNIIQSKHVEIDYEELPNEIKSMLIQESKVKTHTAIYRAIAEVFQSRHGSEALDYMRSIDRIKFQITNYDDDRIYSNPNLINYDKYDKKDFEGIDKIDKVAECIQKNNSFVTIRKTEEILLYNGKIYDKLQAETIIKEETEKLIPNCTTHNRQEVINKIKAQTYVDLEDFDSDPNLITLENGILNLKTMLVSPHTPDFHSRVLLPVEYHKPKYTINDETVFKDIEKNLDNTLFWKFLKSSFTVDNKFRKEDFETVLEIIASPIIKRHIDEKASMFLGNGENGKSVCLGYIESLIGKNNVSRITLQDIAEDKFMGANLSGMSANIFTDLEKNELRHTGKIKAIVSNEGIEVQKKNKQAFTLYPFVKLMFSCNKFPKVFDQTQGFFRRWKIVRWQRNFENDPERIEYLREKLDENQKEKNLVFSCLVYLARLLKQNGKFTHSKDWKEIQKEWNANADPIEDFYQNHIIESDGYKNKRETYRFYRDIMYEKGEAPLGMGQFSKAFSEYLDDDKIRDKSGKTVRVWLNIDFKRPIQTTMKDNDDT